MGFGLNSSYPGGFENPSLKIESSPRHPQKQAKSFLKEEALKSGLREVQQGLRKLKY